MKIELLFIAIIVFVVMDTMNDGKYTKQLKHYKKYIKIVGFLFAAFSMYLFIKKNPSESRSMMGHLNGMIHYMPMD
jgi:CRISPR/Cas system-associated protein endoribonuclease Cas2